VARRTLHVTLDEVIKQHSNQAPPSDMSKRRPRRDEVIRREDQTMQVNPYLSFNGTCEAAFKFYEQCLGAQPGAIFRYAGTALAHQVPADWQDKVMHGSVTIGNVVLMGGDVADGHEEPKGFSLSLQIKSITEAERIFHELGQDGRVTLPLAETFWAARFGMLVDRFGIPWLINCEGAGAPPER
jgi:PhnB protein